MKKARIINAIVWIVIAIALVVLVAVQWSKMSCSPTSMIVACTFYLVVCAVFGWYFDLTIQGK